MATDFNPSAELNESDPTAKFPNPGEIWTIASPGPIELVMIVTVEAENVTIMPLSGDLRFLSDVDVLIPSHRSGLSQDLLVHTWQIVETPTSILKSATGGRIDRSIYDYLLDVGDYYHGLSDAPPASVELAALDLQQGQPDSSNQTTIQALHQQIQAWGDWVQLSEEESDQITPILEFTERLMQEAIELEKMIGLGENQPTHDHLRSHHLSPHHLSPHHLSQWLQARRDSAMLAVQASLTTGWQILTESLELNHPGWTIAYRGEANGVAPMNDQSMFTVGDLENRLKTSQDNETFWATIDTLWQLEPEHPAVGVRRVKFLEMLQIAWVIAIVPQADKLAIRLQVYAAAGQQYLPPSLKLILQDDMGQMLREIRAGQADICIQLKFMGVPGEKFRVRVALDDVGVTEDFLL